MSFVPLNHCNNDTDESYNVSTNSPDVVLMKKAVFEVGLFLDSSLGEASLTKVGYPLLKKKYFKVFIFGRFVNICRLVLIGLQMAGIFKLRAKQLARYCSMSAIISSQ